MGELLFTLGMLLIFGVFYYGVGEIEIGRSVDPVGAAAVPRVIIIMGTPPSCNRADSAD